MLATYLEDITLEHDCSMRRGLDDGEWPSYFSSKLPMTEELGSLDVPFLGSFFVYLGTVISLVSPFLKS